MALPSLLLLAGSAALCRQAVLCMLKGLCCCGLLRLLLPAAPAHRFKVLRLFLPQEVYSARARLHEFVYTHPVRAVAVAIDRGVAGRSCSEPAHAACVPGSVCWVGPAIMGPLMLSSTAVK